MPREKATAALTALLERICAGGAHAHCVTAVYVFGSYARGALIVGDVDVDMTVGGTSSIRRSRVK